MNRTVEMVYWITEREEMRKRKELGVGVTHDFRFGFSNDPYMGRVRYCNVRREDDAVTKWLAVNWRPKHHAVWEIVLARMINYTPSLQELNCSVVWDGGLPSVSHYLKERRRRGEKVFTSAYTISTCGQSMDKIDYVMGVVDAVRDFENNRVLPWEAPPEPITLAGAHSWLTQINGLGSFLSAQVIADLKNTAGHSLQDAPDWRTWAAPGPGSLRGLEAYFGARVTPSGFAPALAQAWEEVRPRLSPDLHNLHMQDFQNCMCEFSKYIRVKDGNGHVRNKYAAG